MKLGLLRHLVIFQPQAEGGTYNEDADDGRQHQWAVVNSSSNIGRLLLAVAGIFVLNEFTNKETDISFGFFLFFPTGS